MNVSLRRLIHTDSVPLEGLRGGVRIGTQIDASHGRTAVGVKPRVERLELRRCDTKLGLDFRAVIPTDDGVNIRTTTWDSDTIRLKQIVS